MVLLVWFGSLPCCITLSRLCELWRFWWCNKADLICFFGRSSRDSDQVFGLVLIMCCTNLTNSPSVKMATVIFRIFDIFLQRQEVCLTVSTVGMSEVMTLTKTIPHCKILHTHSDQSKHSKWNWSLLISVALLSCSSHSMRDGPWNKRNKMNASMDIRHYVSSEPKPGFLCLHESTVMQRCLMCPQKTGAPKPPRAPSSTSPWHAPSPLASLLKLSLCHYLSPSRTWAPT